MNRFTITILFALCISQYANSAGVSNTLNNVKKLEEEVETALMAAKFYFKNYLFELAEAEENAEDDFQAQFNKELKAASIEITAAAQKKGNSLKANKCVKEANAQLDSLKISAPKNVKNCIKSQHAEVHDLFNRITDGFVDGKKIKGLIQSLEKDVEASNRIDANVENKLSAVRLSVVFLKAVNNQLMKEGDNSMPNLKNQAKVCNQKHLVDGHSTVEEIKQEASQCISKA